MTTRQLLDEIKEMLALCEEGYRACEDTSITENASLVIAHRNLALVIAKLKQMQIEKDPAVASQGDESAI